MKYTVAFGEYEVNQTYRKLEHHWKLIDVGFECSCFGTNFNDTGQAKYVRGSRHDIFYLRFLYVLAAWKKTESPLQPAETANTFRLEHLPS